MPKSPRFIGPIALIMFIGVIISGCNFSDLFKPNSDDPGSPPPPTGTNHAPVSSLVLPYAAQVGQGVTVQNVATDEDGDAIAAYRFRTSLHDLTQASSAATLTFSSVGKYAVSVSAKDSREAWSAEVTDTILITASPPSGRTLYLDDGTFEPRDIGYDIGYPPNGDFSLVTVGGTRTMKYFYGNGAGGYSLNSWLTVPRGAHLKFRLKFEVDTDPVWQSAGDDRGYAMLHLVLARDGESLANYFVLATLDLDSDGFPGSPPRYETNFKPGRDAYERVSSGGWVSRDIDLDELARTKFSNATGFNQIACSHVLLTYPSGREKVYRLTHTLDNFEVYVPPTQ